MNQPTDRGQDLVDAMQALLYRYKLIAEASKSWDFKEATELIKLADQANDKDEAIEPYVFKVHVNNALTKISWREMVLNGSFAAGRELEQKILA